MLYYKQRVFVSLIIIVKKKWYAQICAGEKIEEYRHITPFWFSRLVGKDNQARRYETITFRPGYTKEGRTFKYEGFSVDKRNKLFIIHIGCERT